MKKKYIAIALAVILIWGGIIGFLAYKSKNKNDKQETEIKRYVVPENKKVIFNGVVEPSKSKVFYKDPTKGSNYEIKIKNGEFVSKGSIIITYKNEEIESQIEDLQDQISDLKKGKTKFSEPKINDVQNEINGINTNESYSLEEQIKTLKKQVEKLKKKEYINEYAPFSGKVSISKKLQDGENQVLVKLTSNDLYVKANVSERDLSKIKLNKKVDILVLANDEKVSGEITDIMYEPDEQPISSEGIASSSQITNYPVIISLDSKENIVNGYHVQVKLKGSSKLVEIPNTAVKKDKNEKYVYLIKDNKLVKQDIKTQGEKGKSTIVISGLKEKDEIVEVINSDMKEGQKVE